MPSVSVDKFKDLSSALRKLKRKMEKDGSLRKAKEDRYHEKRCDKLRKAAAAARRRTIKKSMREAMSLMRTSRKKKRRRT